MRPLDLLPFLALILLLYLSLDLFRFLKRSWWDPLRLAKAMAAQGIRGPPYKFFHGSTSEACKMIASSVARSMDLSDHNIVPRVQPHFHSWIDRYGRNVLTWQGPTPRLVVGEPEMVKAVLWDRDGAYPKYEAPEFMKKLLGDGLVTTKGKKWVKKRRLAVHAFRSESIKGMIPAIVTGVEAMLTKWVELEGKEVDLFKEFSILASDIISRTAFDSSYSAEKDIFIKMDELTAIAARNFHIVRLPFVRKFFPNQDDIESDRIEQEIRGSIMKLIQSREQRKEKGEIGGYGEDLLGLLMRAHHEGDEQSERISIEDIIDECKTFYFAGQETTVSMLSWTSLLLAMNTEWQNRARMEVMELLGDRTPSPNDSPAIAKLKTMTMILNESLRLYPPVLNILRVVGRESRLGDLLLPRGMQIQISPLLIHHDPDTWGEDAHLFRPERFASGIAGATPAGGGAGFFPFGVGPRVCVGQGLAMVEAKVTFAMILQRYCFRLSPAYVHSPVSRLTCRPQHGLQVVLQRL
ncbi:Cytochrome P450 734A1 [Apostasia shenzhenica]|uniref:Cytochrome P450 734A1 n=1 Tax=Apostasia shenzhenica TaxID=1088818 RepID=A0A2I0ADS0_9ASPA|nr:Cytochrome P450 734A1 [Apostasia shenzhenica]